MKEMLEECLKGLGNRAYCLNDTDSNKIKEKISGKVEFGISGINWERYPDHIAVTMPGLLIPQLQNKKCYIMWDEYSLPILQTDITSALDNFDLIEPLAFDIWLIGIEFDWILEFYHENTIRFTLLS